MHSRISVQSTPKSSRRTRIFIPYKKETNNQRRKGIRTAKLPQPQPTSVDPITRGSFELNLYHYDMKSYRIDRSCNLETPWLVVELKFPGCLWSLKDSIIQDFPSTFTARGAFDYIKKEVKTLVASNVKYMEHLTALLTQEYIPGQNGAEIYFNA